MNPKKVNIVKAQETDLFKINAIVRSSLWGWQLPERVKKLSLSSYLYDEADLNDLSIYLMKSDNEVLGVLVLEIPMMSCQKDRQDLSIHGLYIVPEHQRKGLGLKMLDFALNQAMDLGLSGMTVKSQKDATSFYLKAGFRLMRSYPKTREYENSLRKSAA
ncbi:MAG: GNAT family N-acetyltransferase [Gammaproteobacteria bacterium]|nr:GNAT family N-acetyltransferase [Gammaproteobacteria bacterium]